MKNIYDNNELLNLKEEKIMLENRHQFIYGIESDEKSEFLKSLEYSYPLIDNTYRPMAIYMMDYYLPKLEEKNNIDKNKLNLIGSNFFNLSIAYNITNRICADDKINNSYNYINLLSNNNSLNLTFLVEEEITDFSKFHKYLKKEMERIYKLYQNILTGNNSTKELLSEILFIDGIEYASDIKKMLENKSYFALIIENSDDISDVSVKTINSFIRNRINSDISIKIATDINKWKTLYDLDGNQIDCIHDYGEIILDEKEKKYIKKHNRW